jgi:hypothetical protein
MSITSIILVHFKERENNIKRIIDDLLAGTVKPKEIVLFIDNPEIKLEDNRCTVLRTDKNFLPKIRFALGTYFDTDYCYFIDDDLTVGKRTLENYLKYADGTSILGMRGSILGDTNTPYANDTSIKRGNHPDKIEVDIILRNYFVPTKSLMAGLELQMKYPDLPRESLDDVYLSLGNKYINGNKNFVVPVAGDTNLVDLDAGRVGQSSRGIHYENRNKVCRFLMDKYL